MGRSATGRYSCLLLIYVIALPILNKVSASEIFEGAFKGSSPFYAITVARDTVTKSYGPLTPDEEGIVFSVLTNLLSEGSSLFRNLSVENIHKKEAWYNCIKEILEKEEQQLDSREVAESIIKREAKSLTGVPQFKNFLGPDKGKEECEISLSGFISDGINRGITDPSTEDFRKRLKEWFQIPPEKAVTVVFENKTQELYDFIRTFEDRATQEIRKTARKNVAQKQKNFAQDISLFEKYESKIGKQNPRVFFENIVKTIDRINRKSLEIHANTIQNNPCLVVFNEMFFSKDRPLAAEEHAQKTDFLKGLTEAHPNILMHANFLFEELIQLSEDRYNALTKEQNQRIEKFSEKTGKQVFESANYDTYEAYAKQFL